MRISTGEALRSAGGAWRQALAGAWAPLAGLALVAVAISRLAPIWALALAPIDLLVSVVAYGALMRMALADRHAGDGEYQPRAPGLQWSGIEGRLLGAFLLLALFVTLALLGTVFAVLLTAVIVAAVTGQAPKAGGAFLSTPSGMAAAAVLAVATGFIVWACVRLVLTTAATVDRRRVQVFSTWRMTQGAAFPLFLALLIIATPAIVLSGVARVLAGNPAGIVCWLAYGLVVGFVQTPLTAGVSAYAYRRLSEPTGDAAPHN